MTKSDVAKRVVDAASSVECKGVMISTPCSTWSSARCNSDGGPPILRDLQHPVGIPGLDGNLNQQVVQANAILDVAIDAAYATSKNDGVWMFESPVSRCFGSPHYIPGSETHAAVWTYPNLVKLANAYRSLSVIFDACCVGSETQKTTELLCSPNIFDYVVQHFGLLRCNHVSCREFSLIGGNDYAASSGSEVYTAEMCRLLAKCFVDSIYKRNEKKSKNMSPSSIPSYRLRWFGLRH